MLTIALTLLYACVGFVLTAYLDRLDPHAPNEMPVPLMVFFALLWPVWMAALVVLVAAACLTDCDID